MEIGLILLKTVPIEEEHAGLPLMNEKGNVVGIISFPLIKRYDLNFAMSIENLAYLTTIKETNPKEGDSLDQQTFTGVDSNELVELRKKYGEYYDSLRKYELRLQEYGGEVIDGRNMIGRLDAVTDFIPLFVRVLKYPGSYLYPFDSLTFLTKLIPPDNSFRLFNWTFKFSDGSYRYYGAIQLNNTEELKLIPLYDRSANLKEDIEDTILTNESWFGAQYYDIAQTNYKKKKYYILLGWNGNDQVSHKKVIEILTFEDEKPVFGAAIFKIGKRSLNNKYRKIFEYNSNAIVALKYEPEKNCIVFDHLVPPDAKSEGKTYTYIPDGSYNFYKIKKGRLIFQEGWLEHAKDPGKLRQE